MSLTLPVVSLSAPAQELAAQVRRACEDVGFFYLDNHGIPLNQIHRAFHLSQMLFSDRSSGAQEERNKSADPASNTGFVRFASERLDPAKQSAGDLKESFHLRRFLHDQAEPEAKGDRAHPHQPNQRLPAVWNTPETREELDDFFEACRLVSLKVLEGFATAMDLPSDYFSKCHHADLDRLRFLHYPPASVSSEPDTQKVIRAGAHTDYGSVTLLFVQRDDAGGLQADLRYTKGTEAGTLSSGSSASQPIWTNVEPREGMIICNVADAIEFWTGGRYHSTIHRVALPRDEAQALTRYSIAYFCQPDDEAELRPLGPGGELLPLGETQWKSTSAEFNKKFASIPKDRPVTGGDYLQARLDATYDHRREATSSQTVEA